MRNIVLLGFMGCGKTTLGRFISNSKGFEFVDTDDMIVEKEGRSINDIFATEGEAYFRQLETDVIKGMIGSVSNTVISVGGGLPVKEENRALLRELGLCVYLRTSKAELVRRLKGDKSRPLLAGGDVEKKIDDLMSKRKDIYESTAELIVDTDGLSKAKIVDTIMERI